MSTVRTITIDAAGTLMQPWPSVGAVYAKAVRGRGYDAEDEEVDQYFHHVFAETQSSKETFAGDERGFWRMVVGRTVEGLCPTEVHNSLFEELWETFANGKSWRLADGAAKTLRILRERGYRLAILSNNDSRLRAILNDLGATELFEHLFISSEIGHEKPAKEIFHEVERVLRTSSGDMLHLGDSRSRDVDGSLAAGWQTVLYSSEEIELPVGVARVESFPELLDLLP